MTYAKTPSGKSSKGTVGVTEVNGRVRLNLPRQWFDGKQQQRGLGIAWNKENEALANRVAARLELDFKDGKLTTDDGTFNEVHYQQVLADYGIKANLKVIKGAFPTTADNQLPPKPELSILEIWDMYCEYKRPNIAETTYQLKFQKEYLTPIKKAINAVGEDALKIRNWMLENYSTETIKNILSYLSEAHRLAIKQKLINHNPFEGMAEEINTKKKGEKIIDQSKEVGNDDDVLDKNKSFTWNEALAIIEYVKNTPTVSHWHDFIKFKFLTGCRTGEAIALWWCDVDWEKERILIRRSYNFKIKIYKPTKNSTVRMFPMPKNGELWSLLKSIPQGEPNENVFKSKTGKIINRDVFQHTWQGYKPGKSKGIIPELIKQDKVSKYLSPYNTRHTFITHQIFDLGRDPAIVNAWCDHSEDISSKHYRDTAKYASQINPELPANQQTQQTTSEIELLKQQNQMLQEQMKAQSEQMKAMQEDNKLLRELLTSLQNQLNQQK